MKPTMAERPNNSNFKTMKTGIYNKLVCAVLVTGLFAGCNRDETITNPDGGIGAGIISLAGEIDQMVKTRVDDGGFCDNDVIGVYIVDYQGGEPGQLQENGNRATNVKFTFNATNYQWTGAYDIYWKDNKTPIDVYGYYPYGSPENIDNYAFEVKKDQSKVAVNGNMGGYEASDFLWGKAPNVQPTSKKIKIAFRHKMSNARITLVEGSGFGENEWAGLEKQVLVTNTKRSATINLSTGEVSSTGEIAATGTIPYRKENEFRAIVVPQTVMAGSQLFSITVDGVVYSFSKPDDFTYLPSKMHNFSIKVDKKADEGKYTFTLINESITAWENDSFPHHAIAKEYIVIHSTAGHLKDSIVAAKKDFRQLQNLKITGEINASDFYFMRDDMEKLQALNLKEVRIMKDNVSGTGHAEDKIPSNAFDRKSSLQQIILPDRLKIIGRFAFSGCSGLVGSLYIPEGVTTIGDCAFQYCINLRGSLSLPTTLEYLGDDVSLAAGYVFVDCGFTCELKLPDKLKYIGSKTFSSCENLYGSLILPENLEYLGSGAFNNCKNLTGSLKIPQKISVIKESTFSGCSFNGTLELHDGITSIEMGAFSSTPFRGELILPKNLTFLSDNTFSDCDFSGELRLPENLASIGNYVFANNQRITGTLKIPQNILSIGEGAFRGCGMIEKVIFPEYLESISTSAFENCFYMNSIVCENTLPAYVQTSAFNGVPKDNFTLEVPESAIQQYQTAPGWNEFKRISAHRELVCRPALAYAINTECRRTLVLNAEGDWEVESMPDWCSLSETSGSKKTELTLTIRAMAHGSALREGEIVFKLKDKDYTTRCAVSQYDYEHEEDEIITLQSHSKGNGINLVFLGDGYNAKDISEGNYLKDMQEQVENFFDIEPYKTYRDYFDVYTAIALSPESGIGTVNTIRYTRFETTYTGGVGLSCNYDAVFAYALNMPTIDKSNLNQSLIIITPNSTDYGGVCQMWEDGSAIAFCPKSDYGYPLDTRGVIQHEAGGHGFGKLGDEYIYHNAFINFCQCICCGHDDKVNRAKSLGWYDNLSLTGKMHEVPWSHFIFDKRYSDIVDIFEGGFMHARGVFRSEHNSCMNNNIPYYSTISRESIVKRIMQYAGQTYSFEDFVANDKRTEVPETRAAGDFYPGVSVRGYQNEPVIHKGKPGILK